jgi:NAD(P)-dependent dehydrogenase (short-subunit alcohol dehydrogenase family)
MGETTMDGRVALVVGGGGPNMGRATARLFASRGVSVVVADFDRDGAAETVELVEKEGGAAFPVFVDLRDEDSVTGIFDETVKRYGTVHYLCNFAAQFDPRVGVMEAEAPDFDRIVGVTLRGSWLTAKYAMRLMRDNPAPGKHDTRGAIVFVASLLAHRGGAGYVAYTAAKSGILGLTRAAALDGGPLKIRANCVSPGITRTPATPMPTQEAEDAMATMGALPYVGEPEDQANAAVWLCSDEARFITGATLNVDGGWLAKQ